MLSGILAKTVTDKQTSQKTLGAVLMDPNLFL